MGKKLAIRNYGNGSAMEVNNDKQYYAALDLGTNTFNLVIAKIEKPFTLVYKTEKGVFLGKGGLSDKIIVAEASIRAQKVLKEYSSKLSQYNLKKVRCVATEAIRNAKNSNEILKHLELDLPFSVEEIEGEHEAELIYKGVKSSGHLSSSNVIIMDIGGGSIEFIIANETEILWKKSYKAGISRILELSPLSNPPTLNEINKHRAFFIEKLVDLKEQIKKYKVSDLIGTAGSFDSWRKMLSPKLSDSSVYFIDKTKLIDCIQHVNSISLKERSLVKGMEAMRVETIVPAGILVAYLLDSFKFDSIMQCSYSLSEGVLWEMISE